MGLHRVWPGCAALACLVSPLVPPGKWPKVSKAGDEVASIVLEDNLTVGTLRLWPLE